MATSQQIIKEFEDVSKNMKQRAVLALNKVALDLVGAFQENSPVDKGGFKADWDWAPESGFGVFVQVTIFNSMEYAVPIEEGSPEGGSPWSSPGVKTVKKDGRIWSKQAIGGVVQPVFDNTEYLDDVLDNINQFVFGDL